MSKNFILSLAEALQSVHPLQAINIERPQHFACFSKVKGEVKFGSDAGRPPAYVPQHPPLNLNDVLLPPRREREPILMQRRTPGSVRIPGRGRHCRGRGAPRHRRSCSQRLHGLEDCRFCHVQVELATFLG